MPGNVFYIQQASLSKVVKWASDSVFRTNFSVSWDGADFNLESFRMGQINDKLSELGPITPEMIERYSVQLTAELHEILTQFNGKKDILFLSWLKRMHQQDAVKYTVFPLANPEELKSSELKEAGDGLISINLDITGWGLDNFAKCLEKIRDTTVFSVILRGKPAASQKVVADFLEQLYNVELINMETEPEPEESKLAQPPVPSLAHLAKEMTYRNCMMKELKIQPNAVGVESLMARGWGTLADDNASDDQFYYLKYKQTDFEHYQYYLQKSYQNDREAACYLRSARKYERKAIINACAAGMGKRFFRNSLAYLVKQGMEWQEMSLILNMDLTEGYVEELSAHIEQLPFTSLSLQVNKKLLLSAEWKQFLEALKQSPIQELHLVFYEEELNEIGAINAFLIEKLTPHLDFPVIISAMSQYLKGDVGNERFLGDFERGLIEKIQEKTQAKLFSGSEEKTVPSMSELKVVPKASNPFAKKIKLKRLMKQGRAGEGPVDADYHYQIKLQVQHVEKEDLVQQHRQEEVKEIKQEIMAADRRIENKIEATQALYQGELIGFAEFSGDHPYREKARRYAREFMDELRDKYKKDDYKDEYKVLAAWHDSMRQELFGNLPGAIKYFSPEYAAVAAKKLPAFVTGNVQSLPPHAVCKKTESGELVLDYDPYSEEKSDTIFTPKAAVYSKKWHPFYPLHENIEQQAVKKWLDNDALLEAMFLKEESGFQPRMVFQPDRLVNLWIKAGDRGVEFFLRKLTVCDKRHPSFSLFLFNHYLKFFPHWDHLLKNYGSFLHCLDKMEAYSSEKMACLQKFLEKTGQSRHDFEHTLRAFEFFWERLEALCKEHKADIRKINTTWSTPPDGSPVVYMERLLTILENARDLDEQLGCLNGIVLSNYGAYYASTQEGFKIVSKEMNFSYNAAEQNKQPFNPHAHLYRVEWEKLFEVAQDESKSGSLNPFLPLAYRFVGQQSQGIKFKDYQREWERYEKKTQKSSPQEMVWVALNALLFTTHEKFQGEKPLAPLFALLDLIEKPGEQRKEILAAVAQSLLELYKRGMRFSEAEAAAICQGIGQSPASEYERLGCSKKLYVLKLFNYFKTYSKYGALKFLAKINERPAKDALPLVYALDAADFFAADPSIEANYKADLLLFSALINSDPAACYSQECKEQAPHNNIALVKDYLHRAATSPKPNGFDYFFNRLVQSSQYITWEKCIAIFQQIEKLPSFDGSAVDEILKANGFEVTAALPVVFSYDTEDVRMILVAGVRQVKELKKRSLSELKKMLSEAGASLEESDPPALETKVEGASPTEQKEALEEKEDLYKLNVAELQSRLEKEISEMDMAKRAIANIFMKPLLDNCKNALIGDRFNRLRGGQFARVCCDKIREMEEFQRPANFVEIERMLQEVGPLVNALALIQSAENFTAHETRLAELLNAVHFSQLHYASVFALFTLLAKMQKRDCREIVKALFAADQVLAQPEKLIKFINEIERLHNKHFYSDDLSKIIGLLNQAAEDQYGVLANELIIVFEKTPEDALLKFVIKHGQQLGADTVQAILQLTRAMENSERNAIEKLLAALHKTGGTAVTKFIAELITPAVGTLADEKSHPRLSGGEVKQDVDRWQDDSSKQKAILMMIAKSYTSTAAKEIGEQNVDYPAFIKRMRALAPEHLNKLALFFEKAVANAPCLYHCLENYSPGRSFDSFIADFEKAPFGKRPVEEHFSLRDVERVVDESGDFYNRSKYTYSYRKRWMEAFLLVNASGQSLPLYNNHPAKDLSNHEIQELFQAIKGGKMDHLDSFQKGLYALGLLREAMFRATGQFPYSTQMLALIDCLMDPGDRAVNLYSGQGKTLTDTMALALLWLTSDRVELTTSSLTDAQRYIDNYGMFLTLLGIPHSKQPITANSQWADFQRTGVNYSTFPELSLFFSKAQASSEKAAEFIMDDPEKDKVSLLMNESDRAILDERTIFRLASASAPVIGLGDEWVYEAINDFIVQEKAFIEGDLSQEEDVALLQKFLLERAREQGKAIAVLKRLEACDRLPELLDAALCVRYKLRQNFDYVISPELQVKVINGVQCQTRTIEIIAPDGEWCSPSTTYGNGIQQLLYAYLNKQPETANQFVIEPDTETIVSTNNKNLIDYYRWKKGRIVCSSGTLGSTAEIQEQYDKYGFNFSRIARHQPKRVQYSDLDRQPNRAAQFAAIKNLVFQRIDEDKRNVTLVFCKDIETTKALVAAIKQDPRYETYYKEGAKEKLQMYLGSRKDKEQVIVDAALPGMLTIATAALGRNTDIAYDRAVGMDVIRTSVESVRDAQQQDDRTGREGSEGRVHYIFNEEELHGLTIEAYQQQLDAKLAQEREFNESLYDVLGVFYRGICCLKSEDFKNSKKGYFLTKYWSRFSDATEKDYRALRAAGLYNGKAKTDFINRTTNAFHDLLASHVVLEKPAGGEEVKQHQEIKAEERPLSLITPDYVLERISAKHSPPLPYTPYPQKISIADCTPPAVAALIFFNKDSQPAPQERKAEIKNQDVIDAAKRKIQLLFRAVRQGGQVERQCQDYLNDPSVHATSLDAMNTAHQQFISDFLRQEIDTIHNTSRIRYWFGFESRLNQMADNKNDILLFAGMAQMQGQARWIDMPLLKELGVALLEEYTKNSWFIDSSRMRAIRLFKTQIKSITTVKGLVNLLAAAKSTMLDEDVATNQHFWRRWLKAMNYSGNSRFQNKLDRILRLMCAISGQTQLTEPVTDKLIQPLEEMLTDDAAQRLLTTAKNTKTKDFFMNVVASLKAPQQPAVVRHKANKGNLAVALNTLDYTCKTAMLLQPLSMNVAKQARFFGASPVAEHKNEVLPTWTLDKSR